MTSSSETSETYECMRENSPYMILISMALLYGLFPWLGYCFFLLQIFYVSYIFIPFNKLNDIDYYKFKLITGFIFIIIALNIVAYLVSIPIFGLISLYAYFM